MTATTEQKKIVRRFLSQCNGYAQGQLEKYQGRLAGRGGMEALELEAKIHQWQVYRAFNAHAMAELDAGELDSWFEGEDSGPGAGV